MFGATTEGNGIDLQLSAVDSHNSLGADERYHAPLCQVFSVLLDRHTSLEPEFCLYLSLNGMNDTVGRSGLAQTLQVFLVLPSLPVSTTDYPMHKETMWALQLARPEIPGIVASSRIAQVLSANFPPSASFTSILGTRFLSSERKQANQRGPTRCSAS